MDKSYINGGCSKKPRLMTPLSPSVFCLRALQERPNLQGQCDELQRSTKILQQDDGNSTEQCLGNARNLWESCGNMYIITSLILITIITDVLLEREDLLFDSFGAYSFVKMPLTVNFLSQMKPPSRRSSFFGHSCDH